MSEVLDRFRFHPATPEAQVAYEHNRGAYQALAKLLLTYPDCRERSLALTSLQESLMWANSMVAMSTPVEE